jgi:hypothetical protein
MRRDQFQVGHTIHRRGRRRSRAAVDAALTRLGARKASEIVMLTWRLLQACRAAIPSSLAAPASISNSYRRPRDRGDELPPGAAVGSGSFRESSIRLRRRLAPPQPEPRHGQEAGGAGFHGAIRARNGDSTGSVRGGKPVFFWIILLLVSGRTDHGPIRVKAQWKEAGSESGSKSTHRGSNPGAPASHQGPSPRPPGILRTDDISGG